VKLYQVIRAENDKDLYLVFDLMECDLHFVIHEKRLTEQHRKYITYQLLKALKYLHSAQLVHRDLKPSNLLINGSCLLKVCDFGLVRSLANVFQDEMVLTEEVATRWYRAPEVLLGSKLYGCEADLWSAGCIIGEMLHGKPMFTGNSTLNQI
jgi:mitogen-activated protein kinase 15